MKQKLLDPKSEYFTWFEVIICRMGGHSCGGPTCYELDDDYVDYDFLCKSCGDILE